jgi:hypothetical protein
MWGQMRVTRALVGSVGAGLCLVAAAVTALFILSAVVAVRGWPGIDPENDLPRVTLAESSLASADAAVPAGGPVAAATSAGAPDPIVLGGAPSGGEGASEAAPRRSATRRPAATGDGTAPGPAAPSPQAGTTSPSAPGAGAPAPAGSPVAETIRDTGETAGGVTDPVAPGSGPAVTQVTDTVADTVGGTGRAVEKAVPGDAPGAVGGLLGGGS